MKEFTSIYDGDPTVMEMTEFEKRKAEREYKADETKLMTVGYKEGQIKFRMMNVPDTLGFNVHAVLKAFNGIDKIEIWPATPEEIEEWEGGGDED